MKKFTKITSTCVSISTENIDTDQIVPARFLKITTREGFGKYLFYDWRYDHMGKIKHNNVIDVSKHRYAKILIAGNNFGCGSSREHAVWAILDYGFDIVISSSYGDIFYNNSLKNVLLPVILKPAELNTLFRIIQNKPGTKITVELERQIVICHPALDAGSKWIPGQARNDKVFHFPIDQFRKTCLLKGVDELGYILSHKKDIKEFEEQHKIYLNH